MKIKAFLSLPLCLAAAFMSAVSCSTDETFDTTLDLNDCIVTSATLGTIYRIMSAGADSTYRVTVNGAYYPLSIDQVSGRIFNPDSLPVGTDLSRVVFSAFNTTGSVSIRTLDGERDTLFVLTDSTDFRKTRELTVYSYDGKNQRKYKMDLNVHQEEADSFVWRNECVGAEALMGLKGDHRVLRRADGTLLVFGVKSDEPVVLSSDCDTNKGGIAPDSQWQEGALPTGFSVLSVCCNKNRTTFYALATSGLVTSTDGLSWQEVDATFVPDVLLGAGTKLLVGMKEGRFCSSADGGVTWNFDAADEADQLPEKSVRMSVAQSLTDPQLEELVVVGLRNGVKTDSVEAVVWRRTVDLSDHYIFDWYCLPGAMSGAGLCPVLNKPMLMPYDGGTLLLGVSPAGQRAVFYMSRDNGRTWQADEIDLPSLTVDAAPCVSATVDNENNIWLLESSSGSLWRGRHNRLGWADYSGRFERSQKK